MSAIGTKHYRLVYRNTRRLLTVKRRALFISDTVEFLFASHFPQVQPELRNPWGQITSPKGDRAPAISELAKMLKGYSAGRIAGHRGCGTMPFVGR
jgi:hypothetical protein